LIEEIIKAEEAKEVSRANEFAAREERIANAMNAMADTVIKKKNDEEKLAAKRAIDAQMEKERQAELKDK
jgi:hypothetical protein